MYGWSPHLPTQIILGDCVLWGWFWIDPRLFLSCWDDVRSFIVFKDTPSTSQFTIRDDLAILWCSILAMQCLCCKWKKLSKFVGDESASFINSSFIRVQLKPSFHGAVANEGANRLSPRRHYGVFIWICLMFHPLVIWTLFHVHHQKDIKQDAEFKIRSQSKNVICVFWLHIYTCVCLRVCIWGVFLYALH